MSNFSFDRVGAVQARARQRFDGALWTGRRKRLWARLVGRSRMLLFLGDVAAAYDVVAHHDRGRHAVRIDQIRGSDGRTEAFDIEFWPLNRQTEGRWVSIAAAMLTEPTRLPPVELVQVGDTYYVIDGHHRISVARALHNLFYDAEVTEWDVRPHRDN